MINPVLRIEMSLEWIQSIESILQLKEETIE